MTDERDNLARYTPEPEKTGEAAPQVGAAQPPEEPTTPEPEPAEEPVSKEEAPAEEPPADEA